MGSVKAEALRSDMASASEYLASITLDGAKVLPKAGCNPPGNDYDCDFWNCPVVSGASVVSQTGSIAVGFDVKETSWDCDCDTNTFECSAENKVAGRTAIEAAVRITLDPKCDKIVKVIYKAGKNSQTQAQRNAEIIKGTISVCKGVEYSVKAEALRGDMASASEYLASITLDGAKVLLKAGCNPPGNDLDCDFWNCPVVSGASVVSQTGSIAVGFDVKETSWDCDCDTNTFECSKENSVKGRTAIEAAVRFTLTPKCDADIVQVIYKAGKNSQTQAQRNAEIIKGTLSACPGIRYSVKAEALRCDMASASEYLASITLDGAKVLPKAGCNPPGSDTACDFVNCPVVSGASVVSQTGSIAVGFDVKETSWDCDCDTNTFECSAENKVAGRTAIEAAVR